nr:hypothetical protein [Tanacetum cinerariifolium]
MVIVNWKLRPKENDLNLFTLKVNHGGVFTYVYGLKRTRAPKRVYKGENADWFDDVDVDDFSVLEVSGMVKELSYENPQMKFYYKKPTAELDKGLEPLRKDIDVLDMLSYVNKYKLIEVFIGHPIDNRVMDTIDLEQKDASASFKDTHTCLQSMTVRKCTSLFLSREIEETIKPNSKIPLSALKEQLQKKYEIGLRQYVLELKERNPYTTVKIDVERDYEPDSMTRQFRRIYVCLGAMKSRFKAGQRDILALDGCFMFGPFPMQILTAVGVDPNYEIYHLAYAIVESENKQAWLWFLDCLRDELELFRNSNFTFVTDRQKGLIPALAETFPAAEHRISWNNRNLYQAVGPKGNQSVVNVEERFTYTPPEYHKPAGRPLKKRKKSAAELFDGLVKNGKLSRFGQTVTFCKCGKKVTIAELVEHSFAVLI